MIPVKRIQKSFNQAAKTYEEHGTLQREVSETLVFSFLSPVTPSPELVLDIGSGTGFTSRNAKRRWKECSVFSLDISSPMAREAKRKGKGEGAIVADGRLLPFKEKKFDMVLSSLVLHWIDGGEMLKESFRVLKPKGILAFSAALPGTLKDLRHAYDLASRECAGRPAEFREFLSVNALKEMVLTAGFSNPAFFKKRIVKRYENARSLLKSLKNTGVALAGRPANPPRRDVLDSMIQRYPRVKGSDAVEATYEIGYVLGTKT